MTSATAFITLLLACIILQCSVVTAARTRIRNTEKLAERNTTRQGFGEPCSCEAPCKQGKCGTGTLGLLLIDKPSCFPELDDSFLPEGFNQDDITKFKAIQCNSVCIAADMLGGFGSHELIFEKHVLAPVMCDSSSSCATKGHIVNYKGTGMMMGSYCDIVGCQEKIMPVNSPKYSRALQVKSKSPDMHFTAFAARFETRGEEAVLAAAVRVGL